MARQAGDPVLLGECLVNYGLNTTGDLPLCILVHEEAIRVTHQSGDRTWLGWAHNNFGNGLLTHKEISEARDQFERARAIFTEIGMPNPAPLINLGWVCLHIRDIEDAEDWFSQSVLIAHRHHMRHEGAYGVLGLACVSVRQRDFDRAARLIGVADAEIDACGQSWAEPERSYRQTALDTVKVRLGRGAETAYDSGRVNSAATIPELIPPPT